MTQFIKIPSKAPFDINAFKARYLELTGEKIQGNPLVNDVETHYLVGSSRLTQEIADKLTSEFPLVNIAKTMPAGWITK